MNIFSILFLFLEAIVVIALPVNETRVNSFYNVLTKDCPNINLNNSSFSNEEIFQKCTNWQLINGTKTLSLETQTNVLCLLYYDAFISFCAEIKKSNVANITLTDLTPDVSIYNVSFVCKNLALLPPDKKFIHVLDIIDTEPVCNKLCTYFNATLVKECGLAYYFFNYKASNADVLKIESKTQTMLNSTVTNTLAAKPKLIKQTTQPTNKSVGVGEAVLAVKSKEPETVIPPPKNKNVTDQQLTDSTIKKDTSTKGSQSSTIVDKSNVTNDDKLKDPNTDKEQSNVRDEPELLTSQKTPSDRLLDKQTKVENAPIETDQLPMDEQNSFDQAEQMTDGEDAEEEENDVGFPDEEAKNQMKATNDKEKNDKPSTLAGDVPANYNTVEDMDGESYFFSYFMVICVLFVLGYVGYHNRQKVMALMLEGKRGRRQVRSRRPNSANYHKLDSNLEEAISSTCTKNSSHIIY